MSFATDIANAIVAVDDYLYVTGGDTRSSDFRVLWAKLVDIVREYGEMELACGNFSPELEPKFPKYKRRWNKKAPASTGAMRRSA